MSQHDLVIDNALFPATRADLNSAFQALGTLNSGPTAPSPTYAYQMWCDTSTSLLKQRNGANSAWITIGTLGSTNLGLMGTNEGKSYASTLTELKNLPVFAGKVVYRSGRTSYNDGGYGHYYWDASSSATADDATVIASNVSGTGRWLHIYEGYAHGELFGAVGNGTTDDATAMVNAVVYIHNKGGGVLKGMPGKKYRFASTTAASAYTNNCLLPLLKNVSIDGQGCTFFNNSMPNRFMVAGGLTNPPATVTTKYITADFTHTDTTLTLDNVTGLTQGAEVWVRCGEDAGDTVESSYYFFATITNIAGNVITLDKPVNQSGTVASFVNAENKSVRVYPTSAQNYYIKNITIEVTPGGHTGGGNNSSPALYQYRGRNVIWENVIVKNAQAAYYQYMENVTMNNVKVLGSPFHAASSGRAWNFAECRGVHVNNWYVEGITASVAYVEFYSSNIRFTNGTIHVTESTWPLGGFRYLFGAVYNTQLTVDTLTVYGLGGWNMVENGSGEDYTTFRDIEMKTVTRARNLGVGNYQGSWIWNTPTYVANENIEINMDDRTWFWQRIPLVANMSGTYFYYPSGFMCGNAQVFTSNGVNLTHLTELRISRDGQAANTGKACKSSMVVGQMKRVGVTYGTDDGSSGIATTPILSRVRLQVNTAATSPTGFLIVGIQLAFCGNKGTYFTGIPLTDTEANQMFA